MYKFVKFCDRQERISKKQDGRLVGRIPSFRGEYSQLFFYKLHAFLDYSYHKQFFLFKAFASITSAPPLRKILAAPLLLTKLLWFFSAANNHEYLSCLSQANKNT